MQITLMRHGETDWNVEHRWQGFAPVPLNEHGRQQAQAAGMALKTAAIDHIVASDLLRTRQTAAIVAEALALPVDYDRRWREINVGNWQGLTRNEIEAWDADNWAAFIQAPYLERGFPDGENNQQHMDRSAQAIHDLATQYAGRHVLVVTHGGSIRATVYRLTNTFYQQVTGNCSLTRFHYNSDGWQVLNIASPADGIVW